MGSTWAQCILDNKVQVASNFRNADFVRAPDGTYYVIAQYDQWRARLFRSRMQGVGSNNNTDGAWSEWCPNTATADGGPTPKPGGVQTWIGKGAMAADGRGNVVDVVLGSSTDAGTTADLVAALVSTDDGHTFKASQIVNDGVPGGTCAASTEDLPDATFDMTTNPPTLWVVWRHEGASSFGGCVRRGMLTPADGGGFTGGITWLDDAKSVGGMDRENDLDTGMGQGGMRIQAGDGVVTIGYSNNDEPLRNERLATGRRRLHGPGELSCVLPLGRRHGSDVEVGYRLPLTRNATHGSPCASCSLTHCFVSGRSLRSSIRSRRCRFFSR